jgi:spermidine dehydrogenase
MGFMKPGDRNLGMDRHISRRDLLHGVGALTTGTLLPGSALADAMLASEGAGAEGSIYPPALTGLRGNHAGSLEVIHQLVLEGQRDWGPVGEPDTRPYDLVVVGAGISGLSAAHFYRKAHPDARVLILDIHDDFGGHAKRNEFQVGDRTLIGYGGAQTLQEPSGYSDSVKELLHDLGVDIDRFDNAYDQAFYRRNGLGGGLYFNKEKWGVDRTVPLKFGLFQDYIPVAETDLTVEEAVAQVPISEPARAELLRLVTMDEDQIPDLDDEAKLNYLESISYREFLIRHLNITEPEVFEVLQDLTSDIGVGIDAAPAYTTMEYSGLPGWDAAGLPEDTGKAEPYIHHFPDGNASIARLLVRSMIPAVAPGNTMEDVVRARFDYSKLDQANAPVRIRLLSTVTNVAHTGDTGSNRRVSINYVRGGQAFRVQARRCVLACDNSAIPYLCPELPAAQREALAVQVKVPILYTSVALRNWRAWKALGIGAVYAPGSYHVHAMLDFPVSIGNYAFSSDPGEPIVAHLERFPHVNNKGLTASEQNRRGRYELMSTSFETIERNVRTQLAGMLGAGGFDPARDIAGLTVNRWAHGYAHFYNPLFETEYADEDDERYPHMRARKTHGQIAIANADSAASANFKSAVEQGYRAANELA